jgi:peroxiredoxin
MAKDVSVGDAAPNITLKDSTGSEIQLNTLWETTPTVIVFLRHFGWPHCRAQAAQLRREKNRFDDIGYTVILVGLGSPEQAARFKQSYNLPFTVLCDPQKVAYKAYGLFHMNPFREITPDSRQKQQERREEFGGEFSPDQDMLQLGGAFAIDTTGTLRFVHRNLRMADYATPDEIVAALTPEEPAE